MDLETKLAQVISDTLSEFLSTEQKGTNILSEHAVDIQQREINGQYSKLTVGLLDSVMTGIAYFAKYRDRTLENVKQFCKVMNGYKEKTSPNFDNKDDVKLRIQLILEETFELIEALGYSQNQDVLDIIGKWYNPKLEEAKGDKVSEALPIEVLDALIDLRYVLDGSTFAFGLDEKFAKGFDLVHKNNMTKFITTEYACNINHQHYKNEYNVDVVFETRYLNGRPVIVIICEHDPRGLWKKGKVLKPCNYKPVDLSNLFKLEINFD